MISRPVSDNPHAHASLTKLSPAPHPAAVPNRFAQPVSASNNAAAASSAGMQSQNNAFSKPSSSADAQAQALPAQSVQPLPQQAPPPPPPSSLGGNVDTYA